MNRRDDKLRADGEAAREFRRALNVFAKTRSASAQKRPGLIQEILPALTALGCFLDDIQASPAEKLPFEYLLSAIRAAEVGNPHPLFKFSNRKAASRDLEIDLLREQVVYLVVVTASPEEEMPKRYDAQIRKVHEALKDEIESIKIHSRTRPRKGAAPGRPWQAVRRWLEDSIPSPTEIARYLNQIEQSRNLGSQPVVTEGPNEKTRSTTDRRKTRRLILWLDTLKDRELYRSLLPKDRAAWFDDQVEFIREEFTAVLSARKYSEL